MYQFDFFATPRFIETTNPIKVPPSWRLSSKCDKNHAKTQGWFDLVEILSTAAPEVIAGFLGVLAATGMDLLDDWPPSFAEDG